MKLLLINDVWRIMTKDGHILKHQFASRIDAHIFVFQTFGELI